MGKLEKPIFIHNIRSEPDSKGLEFIVHGEVPDESGTYATDKGAVYSLDFKKILDTHEFPNCKESDYEHWSPTEHHCLLGKNLTLERRKQTSRCFNGHEYERIMHEE